MSNLWKEWKSLQRRQRNRWYKKPNFSIYDSMEQYPYVYSALRVYTQETLQVNPDTGKPYEKRVISGGSKAQGLIEELEDTFLRWYQNFLIHNTYKYGEVAVVFGEGDREILVIPPTHYDYDPEEKKISIKAGAGVYAKSDEISEDKFVRFALFTDMSDYPYGTSILKPVVRLWKRLKMLEDAITVYRLSRATQRYIFRVYTGDLPPEEARRYVLQIRDELKKNKVIDPRTGDLSVEANFWDINDDLWISVGSDGRDVQVDILQGNPNIADIGDIEYFLSQFFGALNIPKAYMGNEYDVNRATLVMQDVRFGRVIRSLQPYFARALEELFEKYIKANGVEATVEVKFYFPNIEDMTRIEYLSEKANLLTMLSQMELPDGKYLVSPEEIRAMWKGEKIKGEDKGAD